MATGQRSTELMPLYYFLNDFWIKFNVFAILPFLFACGMRLRYPQLSKKLWSDHISRVLIAISWFFYLADIAVKYQVDGADSVCQKGLFIHHFGSLFILPPLVLNSYIPWWVNPIGFMHGFAIRFPELTIINYIYGIFLLLFTYKMYQEPHRQFRGYWACRMSINLIWVFAITVLLDDCSNYLPTGPDS